MSEAELAKRPEKFVILESSMERGLEEDTCPQEKQASARRKDKTISVKFPQFQIATSLSMFIVLKPN